MDESLYMTRDFVARALRCKISLYLIRPIGLNSVTWQLNFDSDLDPFESFSAAARQARGIRMSIVDYQPKEQISFEEKCRKTTVLAEFHTNRFRYTKINARYFAQSE